MSETLVRLEAVQELIIEKLTKTGIFKTKAEVIRAGIIELGKEYGIISEIKQIEDELALKKLQKISAKIKSGSIKTLSLEEVKKKYPDLF